ncbi:MAG TPA: V-type ATP synthase subunit F [Firmicutes bacterium]|nr:V-type ATP synthase subunit F [Candidatus Fermentithermobacillaceae bacterium]
MSRVAVLGQRDAVLGFKASGAVCFPADDPEEARAALAKILEGDYAILLVTEEIAEALRKELSPLYEKPRPIVTILPDARKPKGIGMELLRKRVERAVGANILFKGEE